MQSLFHITLWSLVLLCPVIFLSLLFIPAPYGRHARPGFGPRFNNQIAWFIMESPAIFVMVGLFVLGTNQSSMTAILLTSGWLLHYVHRTCVFPFRMAQNKKVSLSVIALGFLFNLANGYINGYSLNFMAVDTPHLFIGGAIFFLGMAINVHSDNILLRLKKNGGGYQIPQGGLFRFVSCPNYLGEIIEWSGFAIACWSLPAVVFALWTAANLLPRALTHHQWYTKELKSYPQHRKALLPYIL